ncbi:hypothetical protein C8R48DRAFT_668915 [Suillus tomentosus]|nr:hypothetical protein C8R48DRAFT_668915 [Suillus tomentosus]
MSRPQTRPGNVNKHPGNIVREANQVQSGDNEISQPVKKQHAALKLSFRDSVNANRKVSNGGVTVCTSDSDTHVGSTTKIGDGKIKTFTNLKQVISSDLAGPIPDWVEKVASQTQLKLSAPPSMQRTARPTKSTVNLDDKPEEYSEPAPKVQSGKILEDPEADEELENLEDLDAAKNFKMLEDGEAKHEDEKAIP